MGSNLVRSPARAPSPDDVFAEVAELAAQLCGAEHAAITLHEGDAHRVLASSGGLALEILPRDSRFCCEVLHSGAPLRTNGRNRSPPSASPSPAAPSRPAPTAFRRSG